MITTPPEAFAWSRRHGRTEIRFIGDGDGSGLPVREGTHAQPPVAWCRQVHSSTVRLVESAGPAGNGDALVSPQPDLALRVVTADCVPVLVSDGDRVAAVHAGWRGVAAGVVGSTLSYFPDPRRTEAWVGPAAGPCCYEVGPEVADAVADASGPSVVRTGGGDRSLLDLRAAVQLQLRASGVGPVTIVGPCTICSPGLLSSYRRDGAAAGRNQALIWRRSE